MKKLTSIQLTLMLVLSIASLHASTITSIAPGPWSAPATWDAGVPSASDDVVIQHVVTLDVAPTVTNFTLSTGSITGIYDLIIIGNLTLTGGQLGNTGDVTVGGTMTWSGGYIGKTDGTATGTLILSGTASITSTAIKYLYKKTLLLNGGGDWTEGNIKLGYGSTLHLPAAQSLVDNVSDFHEINTGPGSGTFLIEGTFTKQGSGIYLDVFVPVINNGVVHVTNGGLWFIAGNNQSVSGTYLIDAVEGFGFLLGTFTLSGAVISGSGSIAILNATVSLANDMTINGLKLYSGTLDGTADLTINGNLNINGGTFGNTGNATVGGVLNWQGGDIGKGDGSSPGEVTIEGLATLPNNSYNKYLHKTLTFNGGGDLTGGSIYINPVGVLNVSASQTLNIFSANAFLYGDGTVNVAGTLHKQSAGQLAVYARLNNSGLVNVTNGTLFLIQDGIHSGNFNTTVTGGIVFWEGMHTLSGSGITGTGSTRLHAATLTLENDYSINALVLSGGILNGTGDLTIAGNLWVDGNGQIGNDGYGSSVGGNLIINNNPAIIDLSGLRTLESVGGFVNISNNANLANISGLNALITVGGYVQLINNFPLANLSGFQSITTIAGNLEIRQQNFLSDIAGFNSLTSVGGALLIGNNSSLVNISGFSALEAISGNFEVFQCINLQDLSGMNSLHNIGGRLRFSNNQNTLNLSALNSVTNIGGKLEVYQNNSLKSIHGLQSLNVVGDDVEIWGNPKLTDLTGLNTITTASGDFEIYQNNTLASLPAFPELSHVGESIFIHGNNALASISGFEGLETISGGIYVASNPILVNVTGFSALTSIGSALAFSDNFQLQSISGFGMLSTIGGLDFLRNYVLTNMPDFEAVLSIGGMMRFELNNSLVNFPNLSSLHSIEGAFFIRDNPVLTNLGAMNALETVGSYMYIYRNAALINFSGLSSLNSIGGYFQVEFNNSLTSFEGLNGLVSIGRACHIQYNNALTTLSGLNSLASIGREFTINYNTALATLTGLNSLQSIGGSLTIWNNWVLTDITGLCGLTTVPGRIDLSNNYVLPSLSGLDNIDPNGLIGFFVTQSPLLSVCDVQGLCDYLALPTRSVVLFGNSAGCNSIAEVEAACTDGPTLPCSNQSPPDCTLAAIADQSADANCQAIITVEDVTGVTDQDGDPLELTVNPTTLELGPNSVTVTADDGNGGSCTQVITVYVTDNDADNDGLVDCQDSCPNDPTNDADNDGICGQSDNCPVTANPDQTDSDCDGVGDACDVCPGGNDAVDNNNDGIPDCSQLLDYQSYSVAWYCGDGKISVCKNANNNPHTICINSNALSAHYNNGDYIGPCIECEERPGDRGEFKTFTSAEMEIFPNPASDQLTIHLTGTNSAVLISMSDALGNVVWSQELGIAQNTINLDVSGRHFPAGIYFVTAALERGKVSKPIIIIK